MKIIIFFLIALLTVESTQALELKVLWWNVKNFFDTVDDRGKDDDVLTENEYISKLQSVSGVIKKINADFVGLGEIENIFVLSNIAKSSGYPYYYLEEGNDPRGIDVALLSKYPAVYTSNRDLPTPYDGNPNYKFSRDCPKVEIILENGVKFYLLLTHLKSKFGGDANSERKRISQIYGILDILDGIYAENNEPYVLIMGDFNSERYSEPMNILEKSGLKNINYLYNEKNIWTTNFGKKKDIDYFLVNEAFFKKITKYKLKTFGGKYIDKISDHRPLLLEFSVK
ncbi:MAG TPA: endonuclease/exonuclease/phosphatase family protein [Spirochaetota bacterium]|jgi:endonuclease/exonuclease/phosphatase family metal-dependent hydrolase|nr:MAG: Endonuclease/Exonuclease/phosphatase family protein [Spirochaetes bacterium ADurb.Bin133]HNZ26788.1 endonuclease/exonuclease/phosphatase family protein [Spirochaetota bacterium]HPY88308.1 endonuclease/exonuclease/phosphatase family protein [Spirochaetota bacterium]HQB60450.1 endonuclease/exonuclease/phosphatase family protein [Spirochaetota bacterium]